MESRWTPVIIAHTVAATGVLGLGAAMFRMRKGTWQHRLMGRVYSGAMLISCFTSYGICVFNGGVSWIHGLSTFTIFALSTAIYSARRGNIALHQKAMSAAFGVAVVSGVMAIIIPGRILNQDMMDTARRIIDEL
jgi:uncharacterized membrane protein